MEISLSEDLMKLLEQLVSAFTRVQFQYMVVIIPTVLIFLLFLSANIKPIYHWARKSWLVYRMEKKRGSSVVSLIHKMGGGSLFSFFRVPFITLDDSQKLLKALTELPKRRPIDLILHTTGGLVISAEQIARAIKAREGEVRVFVPQYAMSGGTLIALACDSIHLGKDAILGPLDPQLSIGLFEIYPAVSIIKALEYDNPNRDDKTLIMADVSKKAISQMKSTVVEIIKDRFGEERATQIANELCDGKWTHDYSITTERALDLGLKVDNDVPEAVFKIVEEYPCESSVMYRKRKDKGDNSITVHL